LSISLVNAEDSPLEAACEFHVPLCAGPELSVAATKSFIATLSASALLIGHWNQEADCCKRTTPCPKACAKPPGRTGATPSTPCATANG
jgi:glucosamine--fructose-6-phosphate aminotransferase (isomerizing)